MCFEKIDLEVNLKKCFILSFALFFNYCANAGMIEFELSGAFSRTQLFDLNAITDVNVADSFDIQFIYEANEPIYNLIDEGSRAIYQTGIIISHSGTSKYLANSNLQLQVFNDWKATAGAEAKDNFYLNAYQYDSSDSGFYLLQIDMWDFSSSFLNGISIPDIEQIKGLASNGRFFLRRFSSQNNEKWLAEGSFNLVNQVRVPEPSSLVLFSFVFVFFVSRSMIIKNTEAIKVGLWS